MARNILARVVSAEHSSDLSEARQDVQVLRAVGLAACKQSVGHLVARALQSRRRADVVQAMEAVASLVRARFPDLPPGAPLAAAAAALSWWMDPTCPDCHGLKYLTLRDAPTLSSWECPTCHGAGRRPIPAGEGEKKAAEWAAGEVDRRAEAYGRGVGAKLGR